MAGATDHRVKEKMRATVTVPVVSGDYAPSVVFGAVGVGQAEQSFMGVTVLIESIPANARVELWLRRLADGTTAASALTEGDYYYAGLVVVPARTAYTATGETASYGSATWPLCGSPGGALRVRSGGVTGPCVLSVTVD